VADALTPPADAAVAGAREVRRVGVVGPGTMATGIVEVFAKAGYDVALVARATDKVDAVGKAITRPPDKAAQRGKLAYAARDVTKRIGKHAVRCGDRSGFIVNALLFPYLNDAVKMLEAHYATADDIDSAMKVGCGYPMGPFELLDVVGLDVSLAIERELYQEFREPGFAPAPLLEHMVTAGRLGRKTGRGFR